MHSCPLCDDQQSRLFFEDKNRQYFQCSQCHLVFADPAKLLSPELEKEVYNQHENNPEDQGYRQFLNRLAQPLLDHLGHPPLLGLDFGSGPGPTLSIMLQEAGHQMAIYDPYFSPDKTVLEAGKYDFVTCTEAIEHFYQPSIEWQLLLSLVKKGGWLAIMTKMATNVDAFAKWHYKNDPTHVSFFSRETFMFLARRDGLELEFVGSDVILFRKCQS
ncbi:class I SAM-dependent methyltransferase [Vibrio sp. SS-MA-C1-2]|uniref:class I SAM-dependent methyltransferase n=1 Tax=Vibrio sp. SS-MA-C1-2 TaxID=2908646 RepID=UPI001F3DE7E4|nr:class I SAM-dependent methyltransferase [Vibrio sp. SS-MA-C1-2]UJF19428.1 class I SAM-dependent methyltransferase [Vibrio sp. SS-MA-C1-2]